MSLVQTSTIISHVHTLWIDKFNLTGIHLLLVIICRFGIALNKIQKQIPQGIEWDRILCVQLMEELNEIFILFIGWIVNWTPLAIISLIATAIGTSDGML